MEGDYQTAWIIVLAAALLGGACFWFLLGFIRSATVKVLLVTIAMLFFVTPASIPGNPEVLAPAFIVAAFEAWFQIDGEPAPALFALGVSVGGGLLIAATLCFLIGRRRASGEAEAPPETEALEQP